MSNNQFYNPFLESLRESLIYFNFFKVKEILIQLSDKFPLNSHLITIKSKLSPIISNILEFELKEHLNSYYLCNKNKMCGRWLRQDPYFPDLIFVGRDKPDNGIEVKTWDPDSTEMACRFRESYMNFVFNNIYVLIFAWELDSINYGNPVIKKYYFGSGKELAYCRDKAYFNPPHNIIIEPDDTDKRPKNLQQTNAIGYVFQGCITDRQKALKEILSWPSKFFTKEYFSHNAEEDIFCDCNVKIVHSQEVSTNENIVESKSTKEYQDRLRWLMSKYSYRIDTNFGKLDRIKSDSIKKFKLI